MISLITFNGKSSAKTENAKYKLNLPNSPSLILNYLLASIEGLRKDIAQLTYVWIISISSPLLHGSEYWHAFASCLGAVVY
jgi:hypothetical protein